MKASLQRYFQKVWEYGDEYMLTKLCLFKVANLACSLSTNEDGMKIVQMAANHIETLCPQVWLFQLIPVTAHSVFTVFLLHNIGV